MPGNTRWNDSLFQEIWCQRRDSNSQTPASKTGCYSNSHTLALWCTGKDLNLRVPLGETGVTAGPFRPGSRTCSHPTHAQSGPCWGPRPAARLCDHFKSFAAKCAAQDFALRLRSGQALRAPSFPFATLYVQLHAPR